MLLNFHNLLSLVIAWNIALRATKKKKQEESKMNHRAESKSHQHHPPQMTHDQEWTAAKDKTLLLCCRPRLLLLLLCVLASQQNFKFHSRFRYRPQEVTFTWPPGYDMSSTQLNSKHLQKRLAHRKIDNQIFINFFLFFLLSSPSFVREALQLVLRWLLCSPRNHSTLIPALMFTSRFLLRLAALHAPLAVYLLKIRFFSFFFLFSTFFFGRELFSRFSVQNSHFRATLAVDLDGPSRIL